MAKISLRETYDNRSVIAQIAKVTDTAEDAAETVQEKAAEINDAITEVNAAVQAAEGAVTTANAASASAQQSAQTVAGYNTRLTAAEGDIDTLESDLNSVTLRVQTAEGDIVTIQGRITAIETKNSQQDAAITALQTADTQNVKVNAINQYAVGLTGNQDYNGIKRALQKIVKKVGIAGAELPSAYWIDNRLIEIAGNDEVPIISIGAERGNTGWSTRINLVVWGETNTETNRTSSARIIFIFDEVNKNIRMQVGYTDNVGSPTAYNQQQTLFSW